VPWRCCCFLHSLPLVCRFCPAVVAGSASLPVRQWGSWSAATAASVIGGIGVLYVFGIAGMSVMLDKTLSEAAFLSFAFLPGDVVKAVIAGLVTQSLSRMRPASLLSRA
jgi:biotin transporter BioY